MRASANVGGTVRRADLRPSQLFWWRRDLAEPATPGFAALTVELGDVATQPKRRKGPPVISPIAA